PLSAWQVAHFFVYASLPAAASAADMGRLYSKTTISALSTDNAFIMCSFRSRKPIARTVPEGNVFRHSFIRYPSRSLVRQMPQASQENRTQMRRHNNFGLRNRFCEQRFLTKRQFLTLALGFEEDMMTKRETWSFAEAFKNLGR